MIPSNKDGVYNQQVAILHSSNIVTDIVFDVGHTTTYTSTIPKWTPPMKHVGFKVSVYVHASIEWAPLTYLPPSVLLQSKTRCQGLLLLPLHFLLIDITNKSNESQCSFIGEVDKLSK